jgi:hypothetical protein
MGSKVTQIAEMPGLILQIQLSIKSELNFNNKSILLKENKIIFLIKIISLYYLGDY